MLALLHLIWSSLSFKKKKMSPLFIVCPRVCVSLCVLCVCVCVWCAVCRCLWRPEEGFWFPGTRVTSNNERPETGAGGWPGSSPNHWTISPALWFGPFFGNVSKQAPSTRLLMWGNAFHLLLLTPSSKNKQPRTLLTVECLNKSCNIHNKPKTAG